MNEIFINYRTGYGDQAVAALATEFAHRFGRDYVFRDGASLRPGSPFDTGLLDAVRRCSVLVVVIGPGWSASPCLHREDDWVRVEITEALNSGALVLPVLVDGTPWLKADELPESLRQLAVLQSMPFRTYHSHIDVREIGDAIARQIPALSEAERTRQAPQEPTPRNPGGNFIGGGWFAGPLVQGENVGGIASTHIDTVHGNVNSGTAPQHTPRMGDGSTYVAGDSHGSSSHTFHYGRHREDDDK